MTDKIVTKKCSRCNSIKPVTEFNKSKRDEFQSFCRPCQIENWKKYVMSKNGKNTHIKAVKAFARKFPEKIKAIQAVNNACRDGRFKRVQHLRCIHCGKRAEQYHHYLDYSSEHFFDVQPVCRKCHKYIHSISCINCTASLDAW